MRLMVPHFYARFKCIAERCRHSCCIGWEIDIDEETRAYYRNVPGDFGKRLNRSIEDAPSPSHFRLAEGERCPPFEPKRPV